MSKYVVKPSSYLAESDDGFQSKSDADEHNINVIKCLSEQLYNVRQTSYGGLLRKVRSQMFGAEKDDEDLTHISDGDSEFNSDEAETVKAYWNDFNDNYYIINPNKGV